MKVEALGARLQARRVGAARPLELPRPRPGPGRGAQARCAAARRRSTPRAASSRWRADGGAAPDRADHIQRRAASARHRSRRRLSDRACSALRRARHCSVRRAGEAPRAAAERATAPQASAGIPIACLGLDRTRLPAASFEHVATRARSPGDRRSSRPSRAVRLPAGSGCPPTLAARPAGQVASNARDGEPVAHQLDAADDGTMRRRPDESFGVAVAPVLDDAGQLAPRAALVRLGHAAWGAPSTSAALVGPGRVRRHATATRSTPPSGTFAARRPDHAIFTSTRGFDGRRSSAGSATKYRR